MLRAWNFYRRMRSFQFTAKYHARSLGLDSLNQHMSIQRNWVRSAIPPTLHFVAADFHVDLNTKQANFWWSGDFTIWGWPCSARLRSSYNHHTLLPTSMHIFRLIDIAGYRHDVILIRNAMLCRSEVSAEIGGFYRHRSLRLLIGNPVSESSIKMPKEPSSSAANPKHLIIKSQKTIIKSSSSLLDACYWNFQASWPFGLYHNRYGKNTLLRYKEIHDAKKRNRTPELYW